VRPLRCYALEALHREGRGERRGVEGRSERGGGVEGGWRGGEGER
jgi:hypothetical protein